MEFKEYYKKAIEEDKALWTTIGDFKFHTLLKSAWNASRALEEKLTVIEKIKRKLKTLRMREQQAIKDMNFAECLKLEGAIFHIEDLYQYAMSRHPNQAIHTDGGSRCDCKTDFAYEYEPCEKHRIKD